MKRTAVIVALLAALALPATADAAPAITLSRAHKVIYAYIPTDPHIYGCHQHRTGWHCFVTGAVLAVQSMPEGELGGEPLLHAPMHIAVFREGREICAEATEYQGSVCIG